MLAQTHQRLTSPDRAAASLQPDFEAAGSIAVLAGAKATENLERLEADKTLVYHLALAGWQGPLWRKFQEALAEYGHPIMRAWLRSGQIFIECAKKGVPVKQRHRKIGSDDANELANDTVSYGIAEYRTKVLIPSLWDPTKKASITTFFVGQCILQFPNAYRRWLAEQCDPPIEAQTLTSEHLIVPPTGVEAMVELSLLLAAADPNDPRLIRGAMEMGHKQREIAAMLGTTSRVVETRLYRLNRSGTCP